MQTQQFNLRKRRAGFTLIEMLVALGILLVLATLLIAFGPRLAEKQRAAKGADLLQQWLLIAKQRALRDKIPTGVRLITNNSTFVSELQYIQLTSDLTLKRSITLEPGSPGPPAKNDIVKLDSSPGLGEDFIGPYTASKDFWNVQRGDYLQLYDGGQPHYILDTDDDPTKPITKFQLFIRTAGAPDTPPQVGNQVLGPYTQYRILRGPRPVFGEQPLVMPQDVGIDIETNTIYGNALPGYANKLDILFSPDGPIVGRGTTTGRIILWVRDYTQRLQTDDQTLIVVHARTGFISAHKVDITPDPNPPLNNPKHIFLNPYSFTQDGRTSGL